MSIAAVVPSLLDEMSPAAGFGLPVEKSTCACEAPDMSDCPTSTPDPTIATVTPLPRLVFHTVLTSNWFRYHCCARVAGPEDAVSAACAAPATPTTPQSATPAATTATTHRRKARGRATMSPFAVTAGPLPFAAALAPRIRSTIAQPSHGVYVEFIHISLIIAGTDRRA